MRRWGITTLGCTLALAAGGCAGDRDEPEANGPPGSSDNPLVSGAVRDGSDPDAPGGARPGYRDLVADQPARPSSRRSPCALVSKRQAERIVGGALLDPFEAPQGPTCVYRDRTGRTFVTIATQRQDFRRLRRETDRLRPVSVADRRAYCGVHGAPVLYLPLRDGRVLSVAAQCGVAVRFARAAAPRLD